MKWLPLVVALAVAAFAGVMALQFMGGGDPAPQQQQPVATQQAPVQREVATERVYVAKTFIPVGTELDINMIDSQPWPKHLVLDQFVVGSQNGDQLKGMVTRSAFQPREPFILNKLVNPSDPNFIAGNLEAGMRVMTIAVDAISGLSGFVFPGDRVDVVLTHEVLRDGFTEADAEDLNEDAYERVSETLAYNIRVIAVDQRASGSADGEVRIPSTVSLEVNPVTGQRIILGEEIGRLSLVLRSLADKDSVEPVDLTRQSNISQYKPDNGSQRKRGSSIEVRVVRGTSLDQNTVSEEEEER